MEQRRIGTDGPQVGSIGLGCMGMSFAYGPRDDEESARTLLRALDLGVTLFDTADMYGSGHNEELIGKVLGARRSDYTLATKFGFRAPAGGPRTPRRPASASTPHRSTSHRPATRSLARLGTDHIDLYYAHRRNPQVPIEDTVGAMAASSPPVKSATSGCPKSTPDTLRAAHAVHPIAAVQMEYSLFSRDVEDNGMLAACRDLGVALVAYSPIGRGLLTGAVTNLDSLDAEDFRRTVPRFNDRENLAANLALVDVVRRYRRRARRHRRPGRARLVAGPDPLVIPIPGTKRVKYLDENVAADAVKLTDADLAALEEALPPGAAAGERYAESGMRLVGK